MERGRVAEGRRGVGLWQHQTRHRQNDIASCRTGVTAPAAATAPRGQCLPNRELGCLQHGAGGESSKRVHDGEADSFHFEFHCPSG